MQPTFIIDFDSTLVQCETLDELADITLHDLPDRDALLRRLRWITEQGMDGMLPFDVSLQRRLRLLRAHRQHLDELTARLQQAVTPSVLRNRDWLLRNRDHIYVVSGGFEECIVPIMEALGLRPDHVLANAFRIDADGAIVGCEETRHLAQARGKVRQVAALDLPRPVVVIGDGYTDYEVRAAGEADMFWAFCENVSRPMVVAQADRVIASFDDVANDHTVQWGYERLNFYSDY